MYLRGTEEREEIYLKMGGKLLSVLDMCSFFAYILQVLLCASAEDERMRVVG